MSKSFVANCPRCGTKAFETLCTYTHCIECLYVEDNYFDTETAFHQVMRIERELELAKTIAAPKNPITRKEKPREF